jgi:hypothetical protein
VKGAKDGRCVRLHAGPASLPAPATASIHHSLPGPNRGLRLFVRCPRRARRVRTPDGRRSASEGPPADVSFYHAAGVLAVMVRRGRKAGAEREADQRFLSAHKLVSLLAEIGATFLFSRPADGRGRPGDPVGAQIDVASVFSRFRVAIGSRPTTDGTGPGREPTGRPGSLRLAPSDRPAGSARTGTDLRRSRPAARPDRATAAVGRDRAGLVRQN